MLVVRDIGTIRRDTETALTIGTFDGIHLGHRQILDEMVRFSRESGFRSVLVTFDPHPREVIHGNGERIGLLTTISERLRILESIGIDICVVLPFTRNISLLEAKDFFSKILIERIGMKRMIVGIDHAFGHGRSGRIDELRKLTEEAGVDLTVIPKLFHDGVKVSSTTIRAAVAEGEMRTANHLLGRAYSMTGFVQRGEGLGKRLGFPTANIIPESPSKLLPKPGVYSSIATVEGIDHPGMLNIGFRPTVSNRDKMTIEIHIFDFIEDIYGMSLDISFLERIRDEARFAGIEELKEQLERDRSFIRKRFKEQENTATV
jgi:riboflavin kinase / FMN adenylyltransferase